MIILTLAIGADYRRGMAPCLASKRAYADRHGYTYIEGGDEWWDKTRPIAWSKLAFYMHYINKYKDTDEVLWLSDADIYITNPDLSIETHVLPLFPESKNMLICVDAMDHINSGSIFVRAAAAATVLDWLGRVNKRTDCTNHIWWENGAMLLEWRDHPEDLEWVEILKGDPTRFNAYIQGLPLRRTWQPGDWLIHFAGIYDAAKINKIIEGLVAQATGAENAGLC